MKIARYKPTFAAEVADLFHDSVHSIAAENYSERQLEAWAPTPTDYDAWEKRLKKSRPYIAVERGTVIGFAELESDGHIDCFYVHKDHQRKRVGKVLMNHIEAAALRNGADRLYAEVSITAKPFFQKMGFTVIRPQEVARNGVVLKNYFMEKSLSSA